MTDMRAHLATAALFALAWILLLAGLNLLGTFPGVLAQAGALTLFGVCLRRTDAYRPHWLRLPARKANR